MGLFLDLWELLLGLLSDHCFSKIKKHVKSRAWRIVLYVFTVIGVVILAMLPLALIVAMIFGVLNGILLVLDVIEGFISNIG